MRSDVDKTQAKGDLSSTKDFHKLGVTIADWARARHFNIRLVYIILRGERKCLRGESYRIAKELGMK
jgi:gp16 family phage-associated protein